MTPKFRQGDKGCEEWTDEALKAMKAQDKEALLNLRKQLQDKAKKISFEWHGIHYWVSEEDLKKLVGEQRVNDMTSKASDRRQLDYNPYPQLGVDLILVEDVEKTFDGLAEKLQEELDYAYDEGLDDTDYGVCILKDVLACLRKEK